jgi:phosphoribosylanthranilate isomerase
LKLVKDQDYCLELGKKAKHFIENNWTPRHVAERYLKMIVNDIPADWWYDPKNIRYVHGAGLSEEKAKEIVRSIIQEGGLKALQISDKPQLEKRFLDFAFS